MIEWLIVPGSLLTTGGLVYAWWVHLHSRFTTIARGVLYQSAAMPPAKLMRVTRRRGIDTVIDFRKGQDREVEAERYALQQIGVHHRHLPTSIHPSPTEINAFIVTIREELSKSNRILMHCKDGEGRAVMFAAIYRIEFEGWDNERAYHATARLPDGLRFLKVLIPNIGCLSPRNVKTGLILNHQRTPLPSACRLASEL